MTAGRRRVRALWSSSPRPALVLVGVAVVVAAVGGAPMLYDGAWFFYTAVNQQQIEIPQARITFGLLLWPVVIASHLTDHVEVLRFAFSLPLTVTPVITLGISWWIVRRHDPSLHVWAALGILLANLPGQTHWVATSLRTSQLIWPILLAVLVGLPDRVLPVVALLLLAVVNLHPQATVYLLLVAATCCLLAWREPGDRKRFLAAAAVFALFGLYRAGVIAPGYEVDQASARTQVTQWRDAVLGWPLVFLASVFTTAAWLVVARIRPSAARAWAPIMVAVGAVGTVAIIRWATDPEQWRQAIQYRGPSLLYGTVMMTVAVVDRLLSRGRVADRPMVERTAPSPTRMQITNLAALVFLVVITIQSVYVHQERRVLRDALATRPQGCVPYSEVPELAGSPLDFWSTPALSLLLESTRPERILLPDDLCREAVLTGEIPQTTLDNDQWVKSRHVDHGALFEALAGQHPCRMHLGSGWSDEESTPSGSLRRMAASTAELHLELQGPSVVALRGTVWQPAGSGDVVLRLDGDEVARFAFSSGPFDALTGHAVSLDAGSHRLEVVDRSGRSSGDAGSVTVLDLAASIDGGLIPCSTTG